MTSLTYSSFGRYDCRRGRHDYVVKEDKRGTGSTCGRGIAECRLCGKLLEIQLGG